METSETEKIKKILVEHERRIARLENLLVSKPPTERKKISIKEFILSKNPKDNIQKTLVVGYYLEKFEGMSSFNVKDIEKGFRDARERVPSNVNDKINKNIQKGYIMEASEEKDDLKAWNLTNSGEELVESGFEKEK